MTQSSASQPSNAQSADLGPLLAQLGLREDARALLSRALTHASINEGRRNLPDYERLEFLGDRVLGLIAAEQVYGLYPGDAESKLTLRYNALVNRDACAQAARAMGLGPFLILSRAEIGSGGREKDTILADAAEAVLGTVYLSNGLEDARAIFARYWSEALAAGSTNATQKDPKNELQEWAEGRGYKLPRYRVISRSGPDHAPLFQVEAAIDGIGAAQAQGRSKQDAERIAARTLLEGLSNGRN